MPDTEFELIAAAHTPFDSSARLSLAPVAALAEHYRQSGVSGVLVAGSTGEGPSLTLTERRDLAERWVQVGGKGLAVMIQVGHDCVADAAELARHAQEIGADAICAAPPSWFPIATPEQLVDTCTAIAEAAPKLPFFYYHIPVLSTVQVAMAPFLDLARERIPNLGGVKFTHDDVADFAACVRDHGDAVRLLWGIDEALVKGLGAGAHGAVGSTYGFAAPLYHRLLAAHREGDMELANGLQGRSVLLVETLAARGYAPAAKMVLGLLGVDCGPTRLPLPRLEDAVRDEIRADLKKIGYFDWIGR